MFKVILSIVIMLAYVGIELYTATRIQKTLIHFGKEEMAEYLPPALLVIDITVMGLIISVLFS